MKKALLHVFYAMLLPGFGHFMLGQKTKALVFFSCILFAWLLGLSLDFEHYYWYEDIKKKSFHITVDSMTKEAVLSTHFNSQWDEKIHFFNLSSLIPESPVTLKGHTRPGLTLEIVNETTGDRYQTQADYMGFFAFPPIEFLKGQNQIHYGPANFYDTDYAKKVSVSSYDTQDHYRPGALERTWQFVFHAVFPILKTPFLHFCGGWVQSRLIHWWESFPLVKDQKTIPAPLKDAGFYFMIMVCMLNLIIFIDAYDSCLTKEFGDDIP